MLVENQSVLAVSLPEAGSILSYVQSHWNGSNPPVGSPAHITLLYPWMPPAQIDEKVLSDLASLFSHFSNFDCSLSLGWFGREVLLLVPADPEPFICLTKSIINHWPEYPYYGGDYAEIEPHVTLAYGEEAGLSKLAAELTDQTPIRAHVSSIGLSIGQPGSMTTYAKFALQPMPMRTPAPHAATAAPLPPLR